MASERSQGQRTVSHVPLPSYAQPPKASQSKTGAKLMSLNTTLLAAQKAWEKDNKRTASAIDSVSVSSSSESETSDSDDEAHKLPAQAAAKRSSPRHSADLKRDADAAALSPTSRPVKRNSPGSLTFLKAKTAPSQQAGAEDEEQMPVTRAASDSLSSQRLSVVLPSSSSMQPFSEGKWIVYNENDAIHVREDGSSYESMPIGDFGPVPMIRGTVIPTNYRLGGVAPYAYVCPDTACLRSYTSPKALGGHFCSAHKGTAYNDNCDGTLTKVGSYRKSSGQNGRAIVVTRIQASGDTNSAEEGGSTSGSSSPDAAVASPESEPFQYVTSFLPTHINYARYLAKDYIKELCKLPKLRNLPGPWISFHSKKDLNERMFALAVAYITGHRIRDSVRCTSNKGEPANRLGEPCIALHEHFGLQSCVGCCYWAEFFTQDNTCHFKKLREEALPHEVPKKKRHYSYSFSRDLTGDGSGAANKTEAALASDDGRPSTRISTARNATRHSQDAAQTISVVSSAAPEPASPSRALPDELEMETWEVSPGRVTDSAYGENIGYSNAYLQGREPVEVSEDVAFNVLTIKPGDTARWQAHNSKLRTCSVASGKIEIQIGDNKMGMGPNSLFIIRPGEQCAARNNLYIDATVHCTTVNEYTLSS